MSGRDCPCPCHVSNVPLAAEHCTCNYDSCRKKRPPELLLRHILGDPKPKKARSTEEQQAHDRFLKAFFACSFEFEQHSPEMEFFKECAETGVQVDECCWALPDYKMEAARLLVHSLVNLL